MIVITVIAVILLLISNKSLGYLTNPGFLALNDVTLNKPAFHESPNLQSTLEREVIWEGLTGDLQTECNGLPLIHGNFWIYANKWLMVVILTAIILLILNRILVHFNRVTHYLIDVPVYGCVILSFIVYYITAINCGPFKVEMNTTHTRFFLLMGYSVFAILYAVVRHYMTKKARMEDLEYKEFKAKTAGASEEDIKAFHKKFRIISTVIIALEVIAFLPSLVLWNKAYQSTKEPAQDTGYIETVDTTDVCYIEVQNANSNI